MPQVLQFQSSSQLTDWEKQWRMVQILQPLPPMSEIKGCSWIMASASFSTRHCSYQGSDPGKGRYLPLSPPTSTCVIVCVFWINTWVSNTLRKTWMLFAKLIRESDREGQGKVSQVKQAYRAQRLRKHPEVQQNQGNVSWELKCWIKNRDYWDLKIMDI